MARALSGFYGGRAALWGWAGKIHASWGRRDLTPAACVPLETQWRRRGWASRALHNLGGGRGLYPLTASNGSSDVVGQVAEPAWTGSGPDCANQPAVPDTSGQGVDHGLRLVAAADL